jgi:hypothetical protein
LLPCYFIYFLYILHIPPDKWSPGGAIPRFSSSHLCNARKTGLHRSRRCLSNYSVVILLFCSFPANHASPRISLLSATEQRPQGRASTPASISGKSIPLHSAYERRGVIDGYGKRELLYGLYFYFIFYNSRNFFWSANFTAKKLRKESSSLKPCGDDCWF